MSCVQTGLERLIANPPPSLKGKRIGLLCNPASVDKKLSHARVLVSKIFPGQLKALYSPQHGFFAEKQDNMIESDHGIDPLLKIPVYSLYGQTRVPDRKMLDPIDVLLVDLQDSGTRVYTFIYTMSYCMEAARRFGKKVVVLDRPNPVGGQRIEGNCLDPEWSSFVGRYPIPMRHAMTIGELARMFNRDYGIGCELEVIPMEGWRRDMYFQDTGLTWVAPSPNLPTPVSAMVYPGQVIWEGTNVSEGRGTTQPFELFGAPFIDPDKILEAMGNDRQPGVFLRPVIFEPAVGKWRGEACRGFQLHVTARDSFEPVLTTLKLLQAVFQNYPDQFKWKSPPYEYEFKLLPIDLIMGGPGVRQRIEALEPPERIAATWKQEIRDFFDQSRRFYLYG